MLAIKGITKSYTTGDFTQVALKGVSLNFRESEFVAVLGPSGSGKTTFLNVIGGLDQYDSGDLIINGRSTKQFRDEEWDAYRNKSIGFVFQAYNLIPHLSIMDNVEMGMTLSGVPAAARRAKAREVLIRVGLRDHLHKKPNQLSGGQMQRVAIARALVNDPDIILADEPTGALDSVTSRQILDLIKEVACDKLVIMVTHNASLAEAYADRIIRFQDGEVVADSNPLPDQAVSEDYQLKKTRMSFATALKLSGTNIRTKKGRTFLTAFASSIGIIGIALILSLSNGFDKQIKNFEADTLSTFPVMISRTAVEVDPQTMRERRETMIRRDDEGAYPDDPVVYPSEPVRESVRHTNIFTDEYLAHVEALDPSLVAGISYARAVSFNLLKKEGDRATLVFTSSGSFAPYPRSLDESRPSYLEQNYDLLAGEYPADMHDLVLIVDHKNRIDRTALQRFGIESEAESIAFEDILGHELRLILNDDFYRRLGPVFTVNGNPEDLIDLYNSERAIKLSVVGILRPREEVKIPVLPNGLIYSDQLTEFVLADAADSAIVRAQQEANYNVLSGEPFNETGGRASRDGILAALGASSTPQMISIFPTDFASKEAIVAHLDEYNVGREKEDQVVYTDLSATITELSGGIMNGITLVLIAFAAISLVVSLIMVGIITYISVLERTREIGILRALGARKRDITRVFNAETFIIGLCSGTLGILLARLLIIPTNVILKRATDLDNVAQLDPRHAITLILVSLALTVLGGTIPARMAAHKDPVEALRAE
jgi:putative ABC transport system permease protein